jgi:hypothetical protein
MVAWNNALANTASRTALGCQSRAWTAKKRQICRVASYGSCGHSWPTSTVTRLTAVPVVQEALSTVIRPSPCLARCPQSFRSRDRRDGREPARPDTGEVVAEDPSIRDTCREDCSAVDRDPAVEIAYQIVEGRPRRRHRCARRDRSIRPRSILGRQRSGRRRGNGRSSRGRRNPCFEPDVRPLRTRERRRRPG